MMATLLSNPGIVLGLLLIVVMGLLFVSSRLDRVLPRGSNIEAAVQRWAGTAQAIVVVLGLLMAVDILYGGDITTWRWLTVGILLTAVWSGRQALSDWGNGIVLRAEGAVKKGGRLSHGDARGRILRLGLRSVELEAEDGRLLRLPYSSLAGSAIESTPDRTAARSHTFTLEAKEGPDPTEVMDRIVTTVLLSPWSSAESEPSVRLLEGRADAWLFEVTVHPLDSGYASRIEMAVRSAIGG